MSSKVGYVVLLVVVVGAVLGLSLFAVFHHLGQRRRRLEMVQALSKRFGIAEVRPSGDQLLLTLDAASFRGTLHAREMASKSFATIHFEGTLRVPRSAWSLTSRRLLLQPGGEGMPVELASPELEKHFRLIAERPEEIRSLFDAEMEQLLTGLDAGLFNVLIGPTAGITIAVRGAEFAVTVMGQRGDDEEHLRRALRLIERVVEYGRS